MQEISQLISTLGFPIFVAVWFMWKSSQDAKQTNDTLNKLTMAIEKLTVIVTKEVQTDGN